MMNCYGKMCGKVIDDDSVYCKYCGVQQSVAQKIAAMKQKVANGGTVSSGKVAPNVPPVAAAPASAPPAAAAVAEAAPANTNDHPEPPRFDKVPEAPPVVFPDTLTPESDFFIYAGTLKIYKGNAEVVTIPAGVTSLGTGVFKDHKNLREVYLSNGVNTISSEAFAGCTALEKINFPDGVSSIGPKAFMDCASLNNVILPRTLYKVLDKAFAGCTSLEEIYLHDNATTLSYYAFDGCTSLKKVRLPLMLLSVLEGVFRGCTSLTGIELPYGMKNLEKHSFQFSGLEYITLPHTMIHVAEHTFSDITTLQGITVPKITKLDNYAFVNTNLINKGTIKYVMEDL